LIKVHNMHVVNITMKLLHRIYAKNKEKSKWRPYTKNKIKTKYEIIFNNVKKHMIQNGFKSDH
jgi:hypothetical protein